MAPQILRLAAWLPVLAGAGCVAPVGGLERPDFELSGPEVLDLGWIAREEPVEGRFTVRNVGTWAVSVDGARPLSVGGGLDVEVDREFVVLRPGEAAEISVRVVASLPAEGAFVVPLRVSSPLVAPDDPRLPVVELRARVSASGLVAEPNPLLLGPVPNLGTARGRVALRNLRSTTVDLYAHRFAEGRAQFEAAVTRGAFGDLPVVDPTGRFATLGPEAVFEVPLTYTAPRGPEARKDEVVWQVGSCPDAAGCRLSVLVQGLPEHLGPRVEVSPPEVDFGEVPIDTVAHADVRISSVGGAPLLVDGFALEGAGEVGASLPADTELNPGESVVVRISYQPVDVGRDEAWLVFRTNDPDRPHVRVRIRGSGVEAPPGGGPGPDVRLACTPDRTVEVGVPVPLTATLSGGARAASYRWRVLRGPTRGGAIAATWHPNPETGPRVQLTPDQLGVYDVEAKVVTTGGVSLSCRTRLTADGRGLRATLTWDGPGDLDLHLHRGAEAPWFGPEDCYFDNLRPVWVRGPGPGVGANPVLDVDNTSRDGPETILVETPEIGVPYTVGVAHFARAQGRRARIQLFCGRAEARVDLTSRPLNGVDTGSCSSNDFWTVTTVVFTAPDHCEVQYVDRYRTTQQACVAFQ